MPDYVVPLDLLKSHHADLVNKHSCRFVLETHREDRNPYPPGTLRSLVSALNKIMQANMALFSVFIKKDVQFCDLMQTMDSVYSNLHKQRIGAQHKHVSISTHEHKAMLWEQGIHHIECYNI